MKNGIISYGEAFIDYLAQDPSNRHFNSYIGGATLNVAIGVRKLGTSSYYLTKLGTDSTSQFIKSELLEFGVNLDYARESKDKRVCTVFVHLNENGERYFHSYLNETPEEHFLESELDQEVFAKSSLFYFGSGTLFHPTALNTSKAAIQLAKAYHSLVAFDPNIRLKRWESEEQCRLTIIELLQDVSILKLSEPELLFLIDTSTLEEGLEKIAQYNIPYIWVTLGENGAIAIHKQLKVRVHGEKVKDADTTGAADVFMAGLLHKIDTEGLPETELELMTYTEYAHRLGSLAVTKQGALTALSSETE